MKGKEEVEKKGKQEKEEDVHYYLCYLKHKTTNKTKKDTELTLIFCKPPTPLFVSSILAIVPEL